MQERTLRLRAPVNIRRDLDLSHAVGFNAGLYGDRGGGFGNRGHEGSWVEQRNGTKNYSLYLRSLRTVALSAQRWMLKL